MDALFNEYLVRFDNAPDNWKQVSLLDIADYLNGLAMQNYRPLDDDVGLPVLKIKELRQGFCDSESERCSSDIKSEYKIANGDVIFSWSGSLLVDVWCGGACGLNQHLFKVTSNRYDSWFYFCWTKYHLREFSAIASAKATTMGHIKRGDLEKARVLIPTNQEYDQMRQLIKPLFDEVISLRLQNKQLEDIRDNLLPQLMSGKIA